MNPCAPMAWAACSMSSRRRAGAPEADVVGHGAGEQEALLGDGDDGAPEVGLGEVAQVDAVERARSRRSGPRSERRAGRRWSCPAPVAPTTASGLAGRDERGRARGARCARGSRTRRRRSGSVRARSGSGVGSTGSGTLGGSSSTPESFSSGGRRGLEQVVELAQLLHRLEELAQVEQERGEDTHRHLAVEHPVRSRTSMTSAIVSRPTSCTPGPYDAGEPPRPLVRAPVAVVEVLEDLLVAGLATEGVDRLDPAEALDEVHDHRARPPRGWPGRPARRGCGTSASSRTGSGTRRGSPARAGGRAAAARRRCRR